MSKKLALILGIAIAAGAAGFGVFVSIKPALPAPGRASAVTGTDVVAAAPAARTSAAPLRARPGRVLTVDEAVKDLDLIRPPRQKLAEDFTVELTRGKRFRLHDQRGKLVLVNFWATWCPPCREEMPAMEKLWTQHKDHGFVLLAVSVDADPKVVVPFVTERKFTFPVGLDPKLDLANAYGVRGLPSSFIVDPTGTMTALAIGPRMWDGDAAHSLVEGLLRAR